MATVECPHCGRLIELVKVNEKRQRWALFRVPKKSGKATFESNHKLLNVATAADALPGHRSVPSYLPNRDSHVYVPLHQALIAGMLAAPLCSMATGLVSHFGYVKTTGEANSWGVLFLSCLGGFVGFVLVINATWWFMVYAYNKLLWRAETVTGLDIDQDGEVGKPEPQKHIVRGEFKEESGNRWQFVEFEIEPRKLREFAKDVLSGKGFSERTATGNGMSQAQWNGIRDRFMDRSWAQWKNPEHPKVGVVLTHRGRAVLQTVAHSPEPKASGDLAERWDFTD